MDPDNDLRKVYGPPAEFAAVESDLQSRPPPRSPAPDHPSDPDATTLYENNLRREDRVRTYALTGQQIIPDPAVPVFQGLWSLEAKGPRRYMMSYGDVNSVDPYGDHPEMECLDFWIQE
ncbi:hypothetical protein CEP52_003811 [Fusarium oligoseptatum]|uniref:Uncharacterized protein n=1 Tax=Fusarium oligoseptatum TaxID=2604345 RepID=A0A428U6Z5_9HYPO|nr:hypothetical protein CEP52_003811 [Fusarium oligoseptatum]